MIGSLLSEVNQINRKLKVLHFYELMPQNLNAKKL